MAETVETKRPWPRSSQPGSRARAARTWAMTLTSQAAAQISSSASSVPGRSGRLLAHQVSTVPPRASRAASTTVEASPQTGMAPVRSATSFVRVSSRSLTTTRAPSRTKRSARAAPMPPAAPVTTIPVPCTEEVSTWLPISDLPAAGLGRLTSRYVVGKSWGGGRSCRHPGPSVVASGTGRARKGAQRGAAASRASTVPDMTVGRCAVRWSRGQSHQARSRRRAVCFSS